MRDRSEIAEDKLKENIYKNLGGDDLIDPDLLWYKKLTTLKKMLMFRIFQFVYSGNNPKSNEATFWGGTKISFI